MYNIEEILNMLDWYMPPEIQARGIYLAKRSEEIIPYIQPLTPKHNKNTWDNCAIIISEKSDNEIKPYLVDLIEWLQDMNWPGAFCILNRLIQYTDDDSISNAISICRIKAKDCNDRIWECNISDLVNKREKEKGQGDGLREPF